MPNNLFDVQFLKSEIQKLINLTNIDLQEKDIKLQYFQQEVSRLDTVHVISSTDAVLAIGNDFVNRYLIYLSEQSNMVILEFSQHSIRIGKEKLQHDLVSSPFPLLHTVRDALTSYGAPS